jgi:hypothetical protein
VSHHDHPIIVWIGLDPDLCIRWKYDGTRLVEIPSKQHG